MRFLFALLLAALLYPLVAGTEGRRTLYDRRAIPPGWRAVGRASSLQRVHLLVAVKQRNVQDLEAEFWAVADPASPKWRHFKTREEISQLAASKPQDVETVQEWLRSGLGKDASVQASMDAVEVHCSVAEAESLFHTDLHVFVHASGRTILRTLGAHSVPLAVFKAIDFVEGLADFPMRGLPRRKRAEKSATAAMVAPQTILQMYNVPVGGGPSNVSQGPAEFQKDASFNKQDLEVFFQQMNLTEANVTNIVGPFHEKYPDTEATLDVQYITSVGQNHVNWYWTADAWMYQWAYDFFNTENVPDAVSISWSWAEDQQCSSSLPQVDCKTLGVDAEQYVARVNVEFMKIGLRGVSLFAASGDSGANSRSDSFCEDHVLHPSFPASSPYVTAVGATMLDRPVFDLPSPPPACASQGNGSQCASGGSEVAVSFAAAGFTSGGGFSSFTSRPGYQASVVQGYLTAQAATLPPASFFNSSGRGYPDVSAVGANFLVYMASQGGWSLTGGTSAATPSFAGVVAYLNDLSVKKSGRTLGFLNPLLYKMYQEAPETFNDITVGDNICTEEGCSSLCKGYMVAKGWDPVTGLGTPVADKMLLYLEKLLQRPIITGADALQI